MIHTSINLASIIIYNPNIKQGLTWFNAYQSQFFILDDEDIKSSSEKEKGTKSKSLENMKPRRAKKANQDICAIKTPYLTNQEEFIHETDFSGYYTQQEHANN